jgi:hypothetical protein
MTNWRCKSKSALGMQTHELRHCRAALATELAVEPSSRHPQPLESLLLGACSARGARGQG